MRITLTLLACVCAALAGCAASTSTGIVPIGDGIYMNSRQEYMNWSSGAIKAQLFKEAAEFCAKDGKRLSPIGSTGADASMSSYASAEIQFRCANQ